MHKKKTFKKQSIYRNQVKVIGDFDCFKGKIMLLVTFIIYKRLRFLVLNVNLEVKIRFSNNKFVADNHCINIMLQNT